MRRTHRDMSWIYAILNNPIQADPAPSVRNITDNISELDHTAEEER